MIEEQKEIILLKNNFTYMQKKIDNIENMLKDFIKVSDKKYAQKVSVDRLWSIVWAVIWFVFVWLWGALMALLLK